MRNRFLLLTIAAAALSGCDAYYYHRGRFCEDTKRHLRAVAAYESFIARDSEDPRTAEVHVRLADLYAAQFNRCLEARRLYEASLRRFPNAEPWAARAKAGLMACPDYFPLEAGRIWIYGDTASKGKNMRLDWQVQLSSGVRSEVLTRLYAGKKQIRRGTETYEKKNWAVWQKIGADEAPILRYPFHPGARWSARRAEGVISYLVESDDAKVAVGAGVFENCLKVRATNKSFPNSWKYDYYAPGIGRVKTTVGGPGGENPNTELMKFDKMTSQ